MSDKNAYNEHSSPCPSPPQPEENTTSVRGAIRLFRIFGITVFLDWAWFFIAILLIVARREAYSSFFWNTLEFLALFCFVLLHELGHSLAARQVGGKVGCIRLWPLGGIAYVHLPARPGATLWGIFAGPLVNVVLLGIFFAIGMVFITPERIAAQPDICRFLNSLIYINTVLLLFNLLPVYPLDGGQIFRALLWFVIGPVFSLIVAAIVGILGGLGLVALAIYIQLKTNTDMIWTIMSIWLAVFILSHSWSGLRQALAMLELNKILSKTPCRLEFACPECHAHPPVGNFWTCDQCGVEFDLFETHGNCPVCHTEKPVVTCINCLCQSSIDKWSGERSLQEDQANSYPNS